MIIYKQNVLKLLKENGYSTYRLKKEKIMGTERIQRLRHGCLPSWRELDLICRITTQNLGDIIEHVPNDILSIEHK